MTLIMMYKKNEYSLPVIAGDRAVTRTLPLPYFMKNKLMSSSKYKKVFYYRTDSPKVNLKENILIGGAGDGSLVRFIINEDRIKFPKPYLKDGSYNQYVSFVFINAILDKIEEDREFKLDLSINQFDASFLFSIGKQVYWLHLEYPIHTLDLKKFKREDINILYENKSCILVEYVDKQGFYSIGSTKAVNEAVKHINGLCRDLYTMPVEQVLMGAYIKAANATKYVGFGLDIMQA